MNFSRPEDSGGNAGHVDVDSLDTNNAVIAHSSHYYFGSTVASWCRQPTDYSKWKDGKEFKTRVYDTDGVTELQRIVQD